MIEIAIAIAGVVSLVLWLLKRYFTRGDAVRRLKKERRGVRREMAKALRNDIGRWHLLHGRLLELNAKIRIRNEK